VETRKFNPTRKEELWKGPSPCAPPAFIKTGGKTKTAPQHFPDSRVPAATGVKRANCKVSGTYQLTRSPPPAGRAVTILLGGNVANGRFFKHTSGKGGKKTGGKIPGQCGGQKQKEPGVTERYKRNGPNRPVHKATDPLECPGSVTIGGVIPGPSTTGKFKFLFRTNEQKAKRRACELKNIPKKDQKSTQGHKSLGSDQSAQRHSG